MSSPKTVAEALDFAIEAERAAAALYERLAGTAKNEAMRTALLEFAEEERGHERKLVAVKSGATSLATTGTVRDLKIAEYTSNPVELKADADYQTALLYAMHQEKLAYRLYSDLAASVADADVKRLLLGLAQEEAKHKLRFEIEYDDRVLTEN